MDFLHQLTRYGKHLVGVIDRWQVKILAEGNNVLMCELKEIKKKKKVLETKRNRQFWAKTTLILGVGRL